MNLFKKFPFKDKPNTAVITCVHILNETQPIYMLVMMLMTDAGNSYVVENTVLKNQNFLISCNKWI